MDVRVSDSSFVRAQGPNEAGQAFTLTSAGFPSYLQNALGPSQRNFPSFAIPGYTSLGDRAPLYKNTETRSAGVTFYKMHGAHQIKFGGEFRVNPENRAGVSPTNSNTPLAFSATTAYTVGPLSNAAAAPIGQALASFLYGIVGGSITVPSTADFAEIDKSIAGFVQDDWKVTRKLNINFGLRYEFQTALTERYNRSALGFDPTAAMPFAAQAQASYALNPTPEIPAAQFLPAGGLTFAGVGGKPRGLYNAPKTQIHAARRLRLQPERPHRHPRRHRRLLRLARRAPAGRHPDRLQPGDQRDLLQRWRHHLRLLPLRSLPHRNPPAHGSLSRSPDLSRQQPSTSSTRIRTPRSS